MATPCTSGRLKTSSIFWICCDDSESGRLISTSAPNSWAPSLIPFSTAFHQSEVPLVMNISRGPELPEEDFPAAAGSMLPDPARLGAQLPPQPARNKVASKRNVRRAPGRSCMSSRLCLPRLFFRIPNEVAYHNR